MSKLRPALVALAIAAGAIAAGPPAVSALTTALAGTEDATAATQRVRDNSVAKRLALRVARAHTQTARYQALLAVMRALNVGVYSAAGNAVVRGAERHERDFYLYEFEVRILAGALGARKRYDIGDLTRSLTAAGVKVKGRAITQGKLWRALRGRMKAAAARPLAKSSIVWLLVRGLGLRGRPRHDLLRGASRSRVRFDALQRFLIETSLVLPLTEPNKRGRPAARGARAQAAQDVNCGMLVGRGEPFHQPHYSKERLSDQVLLGMSAHEYHLFWVAQLFSENLRAILLTPREQETHKGPAGHPRHGSVGKAGDVLRIAQRLESRATFLPEQIRCYALAGYQLPTPGPIPAARVTWFDNAGWAASRPAVTNVKRLLQHVSLDWEPRDIVPGAPRPSGTQTPVETARTGPDGTAELMITPLDEPDPGVPDRETVIEAEEVTNFNLRATRWFDDLVRRLPPRIQQRVGAFGYGQRTLIRLSLHEGCGAQASRAAAAAQRVCVPPSWEGTVQGSTQGRPGSTVVEQWSGTVRFRLDPKSPIRPAEHRRTANARRPTARRRGR